VIRLPKAICIIILQHRTDRLDEQFSKLNIPNRALANQSDWYLMADRKFLTRLLDHESERYRQFLHDDLRFVYESSLTCSGFEKLNNIIFSVVYMSAPSLIIVSHSLYESREVQLLSFSNSTSFLKARLSAPLLAGRMPPV
jgi:hypothetical protein